jgi:predicted nuclease with TOPRIM domain
LGCFQSPKSIRGLDALSELKALNEEHEKLKHSHTSLIGKHENLEKEYACATNVSSCVDPLEKENANLKTQLEVLTSKHVKMRKDHEGLTCSHDNLQDAYVMLQVSHKVMVTSVKHFQPPTQKCTSSLNSINLFVLMFIALKANNQVLSKFM